MVLMVHRPGEAIGSSSISYFCPEYIVQRLRSEVLGKYSNLLAFQPQYLFGHINARYNISTLPVLTAHAQPGLISSSAKVPLKYMLLDVVLLPAIQRMATIFIKS